MTTPMEAGAAESTAGMSPHGVTSGKKPGQHLNMG